MLAKLSEYQLYNNNNIFWGLKYTQNFLKNTCADIAGCLSNIYSLLLYYHSFIQRANVHSQSNYICQPSL